MPPVPNRGSNPRDMTISELSDRVLDGIGGTQKSLARWALSELVDRLYRERTDRTMEFAEWYVANRSEPQQ